MTHDNLKPRNNPDLLSIVIPCYNEQESIPLLCSRVANFIDGSPYPCEVIVVNDGSSDGTIELLTKWCKEDENQGTELVAEFWASICSHGRN